MRSEGRKEGGRHIGTAGAGEASSPLGTMSGRGGEVRARTIAEAGLEGPGDMSSRGRRVLGRRIVRCVKAPRHSDDAGELGASRLVEPHLTAPTPETGPRDRRWTKGVSVVLKKMRAGAPLSALVLKREQPRLRRERDIVALHSHRPELYHAVVVSAIVLGKPPSFRERGTRHPLAEAQPLHAPAAPSSAPGEPRLSARLQPMPRKQSADKEAGQNGVFLLAHHAHHTGANAEELVVSCLTTADLCQNTKTETRTFHPSTTPVVVGQKYNHNGVATARSAAAVINLKRKRKPKRPSRRRARGRLGEFVRSRDGEAQPWPSGNHMDSFWLPFSCLRARRALRSRAACASPTGPTRSAANPMTRHRPRRTGSTRDLGEESPQGSRRALGCNTSALQQRVSAAGPNAHSLSFVRARRARALNGCVPPPPRASAALRVSAPAPSWAARRRHRRARRRRSRRLACSSRRPSPSAC